MRLWNNKKGKKEAQDISCVGLRAKHLRLSIFCEKTGMFFGQNHVNKLTINL